ncbi:hypothetical protein JK364_50630 [Streptomyces sp. 110]|uniref:NYN domain-containing protein n=1 Tax=Streptomyces endocoffeicus TaxID=2898945 RepID=A0ABS1Q761_9ACTN|nr:DUF6086 family protein [Streptomyces endocoffeicus]MBL1120496.1 hypothetical protein [Streptomyces endocoffeicus]
MSQYFTMGEESLWNPSNGAARLFLRQTAVFEAELGLPSGLGPMDNDECQIDPVALGAFAHAVLEYHQRTPHAVILALSEGFTATLLVLAQRAGVEVCWTPPHSDQDGHLRDVQVSTRPPASLAAEPKTQGLRVKVRELDQLMPR